MEKNILSVNKPVLFLQNITLERPGCLISFLEKRNIPYEVVDLSEDNKGVKKPAHYGAVVILGGPMNVDEEDRYPYLQTEKAFIKECFHHQTPVLGICLGGQLIAAVAGADVKPNSTPEIGWMEVELTEEGNSSPFFHQIKSPVPVFQWHGDTFRLPKGAVNLAFSDQCQNQAFAWNGNSLAVQFHVEVNTQDTKEWAKAYLEDVSAEHREKVMHLISNPYGARAAQVNHIAERLFENFLKIGGYFKS